ncbi:hypothetical protein Hanom_Chr08g00731581 [Helianthus anomalus]
MERKEATNDHHSRRQPVAAVGGPPPVSRQRSSAAGQPPLPSFSVFTPLIALYPRLACLTAATVTCRNQGVMVGVYRRKRSSTGFTGSPVADQRHRERGKGWGCC